MSSFTVKDAQALMTLLVREATGQTTLTVANSADFVSAGSKVLATGTENVTNSLNIVLGRLLVATRPYQARLTLMDQIDTGVFTDRIRKVSLYAKDPQNSGAFNTDLFTNLAAGFTAGENEASGSAQSTKSQYEQNPPMPLEINFGSKQATWQSSVTTYEEQLQVAFRNEEEFGRFISGYMTEHANDIESQREAWNRMIMLNKIGQVYNMSANMAGSVVNLTSAFNTKFGTSYTSAQLRTTYLKEFLAFFVAEFKKTSKFMTERTTNYHWPVTKTVDSVDYSILRHTPYADQRVYLYSPLFTDAEAQVLPEIFNPEFLDIKTQYEEITYWQSIADRAAVNVIPSVIDVSDGTEKAGTEVDIPYVVGMICDKDAMMSNFRLERAATSPLEARKLFRNTWLTFLKGAICDPTENCVLFIMADA